MTNKSSYAAINKKRIRNLEKCWLREIDIDPLILRARWLHQQGHPNMALSMEQEILPMF